MKVNIENKKLFFDTINEVVKVRVQRGDTVLDDIESTVFGTNIAIHDLIRECVVYGRKYKVIRNYMLADTNKTIHDLFNPDTEILMYDVILILTDESVFTGDFAVYMGFDGNQHKIIRDTLYIK